MVTAKGEELFRLMSVAFSAGYDSGLAGAKLPGISSKEKAWENFARKIITNFKAHLDEENRNTSPGHTAESDDG